jgi:hypothetical protein
MARLLAERTAQLVSTRDVVEKEELINEVLPGHCAWRH